MRSTLALGSTAWLALACAPEPSDALLVPVLPEVPYDYAGLDLPEHLRVETAEEGGHEAFVDSSNAPADNPVTDAGATLGRVLFYDLELSANGTVSCASCHKAEEGFADARVVSDGFDGGTTRRHAMGLTNAGYYTEGRFFWDQRAETLEDQVLMPFQDPVEMGMTLDEVEARVAERDFYAPLFRDAFDDDDVTADRIARALAQFVRSMVSTTSRYDEGRALVASRDEDFPTFTPQENRGKALFVKARFGGGLGCLTCHRGEGFLAKEATNNGLDADTRDDQGYGEVTELPDDQGTFKVPSLRNIGRTAPYMHDGRFATLEEVIDHYSEGVQHHPNLGPSLFVSGDEVLQMDLSAAEKEALVAFMRTLDDEQMVADPKFSDPFAPR